MSENNYTKNSEFFLRLSYTTKIKIKIKMRLSPKIIQMYRNLNLISYHINIIYLFLSCIFPYVLHFFLVCQSCLIEISAGLLLSSRNYWYVWLLQDVIQIIANGKNVLTVFMPVYHIYKILILKMKKRGYEDYMRNHALIYWWTFFTEPFAKLMMNFQYLYFQNP